MNFTNIDIKNFYESGIDDVVSDFYVPVLSVAVRYDRIAGFFSSSSLAVAARGMGKFIKNGGLMRMIASPILNVKDAKIIKELVNNPSLLTSKELGLDLSIIEDEFEANHVKALGWMLAHGKLKMKLALVVQTETSKGIVKTGLFHQKVGIMQDMEGNALSFSGSINESATAWLSNDEEFKVFKDWCGSKEYFESDKQRFMDFWEGKRSNVKVFDLPEAVEKDLINYSSDFDVDVFVSNSSMALQEKALKFDTSIPLFSYQNDALLKWQNNSFRMLFEMATGTGKTRTAIAGVDYLLHHNRKLFVIIACPQNTLSVQWKGELEKLAVHPELTAVIDGTNHSWISDLQTMLLKINAGFANQAVVYTTHKTASSQKFLMTIGKNLGKDVRVLFVGDEVHWLGSKKLRAALSDRYDFRIGLSATPSRWFDDYGTAVLEAYFNNVHFEFTLKDALLNVNPLTGKHFLVNYYYYVRHASMTAEEALEYKNLTSRIFKLSLRKNSRIEEKERLERLIEKRADIIKNAEKKYDELERILDELKEHNALENIIIFVSPRQIDRVKDILMSKNIVFHKLTQEEGTKVEERYGGISEREFVISKFKEGTYKVLVAIKCLDEGIDIPSANCGILMASSTNPREYVQRIGRIIRQDEGKSFAWLYDICVDSIEMVGEYASLEKKIREKEQLRMREIAENAINSFDVLDNILTLN